MTDLFCLDFIGKPEVSMYRPQAGLGIFNPFCTMSLHTLCRWAGVSQVESSRLIAPEP